MPVARVGDKTSHGGVVITGSSDRSVNGRQVARLGDIVTCPTHGANPIVSVIGSCTTDKLGTATVESRSQCGSVIITGSNDTQTG